MSLRLEITPPPDGAPVVVWAHDSCFARVHDASVEPDDPADHGRIPAAVRCAFCGQSLPIVGQHPFVFDVGTSPVARRFWSHAQCMTERFAAPVMQEVKRSVGLAGGDEAGSGPNRS